MKKIIIIIALFASCKSHRHIRGGQITNKHNASTIKPCWFNQ